MRDEIDRRAARAAVAPSRRSCRRGSPRRGSRPCTRRCARRPSRRRSAPAAARRTTARAAGTSRPSASRRRRSRRRAAAGRAARGVIVAEQAHGETRAGERLAPRRTRRRGRGRCPTSAHLVLEQLAQRLDQLELHPLGQAADVVVALDGGRRARRPTRSRSRPDRACPAPGSRTPPSSSARCSNTSMNVAPMILRFCSGSVTPASRSRNRPDASTKSSGSCSSLEPLAEPARLRRAAAGRCRRRCTSGGRRSPGG